MKNLKKYNYKITRENRQDKTGHKSFLIWFTGLSGSGKSTLANQVEKHLHESGILTYVLDGDGLRHGLNSDLTFSSKDRVENIRRVGEVAKILVDSGVVTLSAFISPFKKDRNMVRSLFPEGDVIEVYVKCPLEVCEERDIKGLYAKARAGKIKDFTGIDSPYEEPINPELVIETDKISIEKGAQRIVDYLIERKYLNGSK